MDTRNAGNLAVHMRMKMVTYGRDVQQQAMCATIIRSQPLRKRCVILPYERASPFGHAVALCNKPILERAALAISLACVARRATRYTI